MTPNVLDHGRAGTQLAKLDDAVRRVPCIGWLGLAFFPRVWWLVFKGRRSLYVSALILGLHSGVRPIYGFVRRLHLGHQPVEAISSFAKGVSEFRNSPR